MKKKTLFFGLILSLSMLTGCFSGGSGTSSTSQQSSSGGSGTSSTSQQSSPDGPKSDGTLVFSPSGEVKPIGADIEGDIVIPASYEGIKVTKVPDKAFAGCTKITSITVPNSVEYIGKAAFTGCIRLSEITLPYVGLKRNGTRSEGLLGPIFGNASYAGGVKVRQYVTSDWRDDVYYYLPSTLLKVNITDADALSYGAFQGIDMLEEINLNKNILTIEKHAFKKCKALKGIDISMVKNLSESLFVDCLALEYVKLSEELKSIGDYVFENCPSLSRINSEEEGTFNLPSTLTSIGYAFNGCIKMVKLITPFVGAGPAVTGSKANMGYIFNKEQHEGTTKVKQHFDESAPSYEYFEWAVPSGLREIEITNATLVGYCAFENFSMLTSLKINKEAQNNIGKKAFENCIEPVWY